MLYYQDDKRYILSFSKTTYITTQLGPYVSSLLPEIYNNDGTYRHIKGIPRTSEESVEFQYPELQQEFIRFIDPKYINLRLKDIREDSHLQAEWQCSKCGHKWTTIVKARTKLHHGCQYCSKQHIQFPEKFLYYQINQIDHNLKENYKIINSNNMEFDMYDPILKLAIEFSSGRYHSDKQDSDEQKLQYALSQNIRLIRVWQIKSEKQVRKSNNDEYIVPDKSSINIVPDLNIIIDDICEQYGLNYSLIDRKQAQDQAFIRTNKKPPAGESLLDQYPNLCRDWDYKKNGIIRPEMIKPGSHINTHWKCMYCGKQWMVSPHKRTDLDVSHRAGCQTCNRKIGQGLMQEIPYIPDNKSNKT